MSMAAEQAVLGSLMLDNSLFNPVSKLLTADDFETFEHKRIWQAICDQQAKENVADVVTLCDVQGMDRAYLCLLVEQTIAPSNCLAYAKILQTNSHRRQLKADLLKQLAEIDTVELPEDTDTNHNDILDNSTHYCTVNFLDHIENRHILKQLAQGIAHATFLPVHTVFLVGLGVFSSLACRRWSVQYKHAGTLPIGLYIVAEQPSGTAKSRTINAFQKPFYALEHKVKTDTREKLAKLLEDKDENALEIDRLNKVLKSVLFATNATAEALEQSLFNSNGYFSAVSSEQGLFNTILGGCYSDKASNNDLLLSGFSGDYMGSMRISREGYTGLAVGSVVMFAQSGGIETLLQASNGTGLAERFLLIAEQHNLGSRDFNQPASISHDITDQYAAACELWAEWVLKDGRKYDELEQLELCYDGWHAIAQYRADIEPNLADGGRYSHVAIRGSAAKVDMQIMKIAANLHLLDNANSSVIALKHVKAAIAIANAMLETALALCKDKEIIGSKAEYNAILSLFENGTKPRTEREIIQSKSQTRPFKEFTGNKSTLIRETLADMVKNGVLQEVYLTNAKFNGKPIKAYTLAQ